jgi:manganese-dependent inorganic pyrophosphatase
VEGDIKDSGIPYVRRKMIGSTCTIIYECYKELNIPIDDETAKILLAGLISDTDNLNKAATQHEDSVAWTELVTKLNLENEVAEISRLMAEAANNFEGMNDSAVFVSDYKGYEMGGKAIGIGSLDCMGEEAEDFVNRMLAVLPAVLSENGLDMLFAKIDIHVPNPDESDPENPTVKDGLYFIYYGEGAQAVAETIFGPTIREGVTYSKESLSRKQIVPLIMEILQ